jgi:hypothetical protein
MIRKPKRARTTCGVLKDPRATRVEASPITIPASFSPIMVMNKPIPAVIPNFRFPGISLTSFSRKFVSESRMKMIPSQNTAARAIFQGSCTPACARGIHTLYEK